MTATTISSPHLDFRAEIAWLGPIMGAARGREVTIAGAEDPALGKAFCAVLVPVVEGGSGHYKLATTKRKLESAPSDRHGWFHVFADIDLWEHDAAGVLLVLLYNQSSELSYLTLDDIPEDKRPALRSVSKPARVSVRQAPLLPPVTDALIELINAAVDPAIDKLLESETAANLRKGLAEIHDLPSTPPPADELVIAVASCQYPSSLFEDAVAGASYARLGERLSGKSAMRPQCLLLVGDQIYVDGTAGLFDPTSRFDRYVRPYEILYRMPAVREVLRRLPSFMMLDDHEIVNNWEPRVDDTRPDPVMVEGRSSYIKFQRRHGPALQPPVGDSRHPLWYPLSVNGFPVFMADTRTERTWRTPGGIGTSKMMSDGQCQAMLAWLKAQPRDVPKIIASPAILLPRHARAIQGSASGIRSDSWDGYPRTLRQVLACIAESQIPNVVFVSGDEHLSCVARIELEASGYLPVIVHSVHSSPLYAPFPFANSERADLVTTEDFLLDPSLSTAVPARSNPECGDSIGPLSCRVQTEFGPPGDGYSVLRFKRDDGGWTMRCAFDRADGGTATLARKLS